MAALLSAIKIDPVAVVEKIEITVNKYFERKDTAEFNLDTLKHLQRVYKALNGALQGLQSSLPLFDNITQTLIELHAETVNKNLKTIDALEPKVEKEGTVSRVRKTKEDLEKLEADAREIKEFLRTDVAPVLRESVKDAGKDEYICDNNVEGNPPRLTLDYNTTSTCEGQLKVSVLEDDGRKIVAVVAHGQGGVGKTCALRGLADDNDIRKRFSGGTLYLQLGADADIFTIIKGIVRIVKRTGGLSLASKLQGLNNMQEAVDEASNWFRQHRCLFLIDDIWWVNGIDSNVLYALGTMVNEGSRVVYTTRDKRFLSGCEQVIKFSEKETHGDLARRMLLTHGGFDWKMKLSENNEAAVSEILEVCQGLPLAIAVAGETVRRESEARRDRTENIWSDLYDRIKSTICEGHLERYGGVQRIVDTSLKILDSGKENGKFSGMFRSLCVMEKQQTVPIKMLMKLWGMKELMDTLDVVNQLDEVSVVRKVVFDGGKVFIQVHDLILDIAKWKASEEKGMKKVFRRLVGNYKAQEKIKRGEEANVENMIESSSEVVGSEGEMGKRGGVVQWFRKLCCVPTSSNSEGSSELRERRVTGTVESESAMCEWWKCEDDGYIHDNVCRVLRGAGYEKELLWLVSKPQWIVNRLQKGGIYAVERDLEVGKSIARNKNERDETVMKHLEMVGRAARMSCTYVNKNKREAWFQMYGRLLWYATQCEMTKRFVEEMEKCAPRPWAKASMGFLEQAGRSATDIIPIDGDIHTVQMEEEKVAIGWTKPETVGVTWFTFASGITETQKQQYKYGTVTCLQLSQDLLKLVIGHNDGTVSIWDTRTGETTQSKGSHDGSVNWMDVSADGSLIVSCAFEDSTRVWKASNGEIVGTQLLDHTGRVTCVAMSADGEHVVSGSEDNTMRVWKVGNGELERTQLLGHTGWVECVAMSADGERVVSGSEENTVRVQEVASGELVGMLSVGHMEEVTCVAMSTDGKRVVSGSSDRTMRVWEVEDGEPLGTPLVIQTASVACAAISADGERVVSYSWDGTVQVWEMESGNPVGPPFVSHMEEVACVAIRADGKRVVSASDDRTVKVWEVESNKPVEPLLADHPRMVECVAMSADRERVVSSSLDCTVRVWEVESGEPVGPSLVGHTAAVKCVAMSADGKRVVSGSLDKTVRVWEVESGEPMGPPLIGHTWEVTCVAMSADGERVASGSWDKSVRVWEVESGEPVGPPLVGHTSAVECVGMSADGERVVTSSYDTGMRVWEVESGEPVGPPLVDRMSLPCVAMSADGKRVVSSSANGTVRVWEVESGDLLGSLLADYCGVRRVEVNEDGSQVVSYDYYGTGRLWRVVEGEWEVTSRDEGWEAALHALQQQGPWTTSTCYWGSMSREMTLVQPDGSEEVLGTCDQDIDRFGGSWFTREHFAHCKVER